MFVTEAEETDNLSATSFVPAIAPETPVRSHTAFK